jgi:hypothetical protein
VHINGYAELRITDMDTVCAYQWGCGVFILMGMRGVYINGDAGLRITDMDAGVHIKGGRMRGVSYQWRGMNAVCAGCTNRGCVKRTAASLWNIGDRGESLPQEDLML